MNRLSETPIGALLFLPESTSALNVKGEEVEVHPEAKVYMLVSEHLLLPRHVAPDFTVVVFE